MLYEKLKEYGETDYYGFHMPGHKRQTGTFINPYEIDITEIDSFDDLHHPEEDGILSRAQERAARLYGAEETHFLVNGSTAGILSAVSGCVKAGGKILLARDCHRSVYHGVSLRNLYPVYLYPQPLEEVGINGGISPQDVEKALAADAGIEAVFLTSPTYDGICSDVRKIAEICHRFQVPLLVDQAHGAHFPFSAYFPEDALKCGADVVIHSVHKTLPSLTQTALLHIQGNLVNRERIRHYLSVYQTSSPSYVLMASIDSCMELLEKEGQELFARHEVLLEEFRDSARSFTCLKLAGKELAGKAAVFDFDRDKLLISTQKAGIRGEELARRLREEYHLELEMAKPTYGLGISSVADSKEGLERLLEALKRVDQELALQQKALGEREASHQDAGLKNGTLFHPPILCRPGEAEEQKSHVVSLDEAVGKIAGDYVYLYPPGIPLLVPGEQVSEGILEQIREWKTAGLWVHGLKEYETEKEEGLSVFEKAEK